MDEMITTGVVATAMLGILRFGWKVIERYIPNWRERIAMLREQIDAMRDLGLSDAEIRERLGLHDASAPKSLHNSMPKQRALGDGEPLQIGSLERDSAADRQQSQVVRRQLHMFRGA